MDATDSIVVKVTSTADFFGEPSLIRVILEKMVPNMLSQPDREIMFIHRKVEEQATSIFVEIHAAGSEQACKVIAHYLKQLMESPRITYAVTFTELNQASDVSFEQIVASTEAAAALKQYISAISSSVISSKQAQDFKYNSRDYAEMLWDELTHLPLPSPNMSEWELERANYVVDNLMDIQSREFGMD